MCLLLPTFVTVAPQSLRIKALFVWRAVINQKAVQEVLQSKYMHVSLECVIVTGIV